MQVKFNNKTYSISGSCLLREIRRYPEFDVIKDINFMVEYFEIKFSVYHYEIKLCTMREIFVSIINKDIDLQKFCKILSVFRRYDMPLTTINSQFIIKLIDKRAGNTTSNNSQFYQDFFGFDWKVAKDKYTQQNSYDSSIWVSKGMTIEDAEQKVSDIKNKTSGSLDRYIKSYGVEVGTEKYNQFRNKCGYMNTVKGKIEKFGEFVGNNKYIRENQLRSFSSSFKGHESKGTLSVYENANKNRSLKNSFDYMSNDQGFEVASKICKSKGLTRDQMINKYGKAVTDDIIYKRTIWLNRKNSIANFGIKAADDFIVKRILGCRRKLDIGFSPKISKESIKYLTIIKDYLLNNGFKEEDITTGITGGKEKIIYLTDKSIGKRRFYDFCIEKLNFIIEYNGSAYHVNKNILSESDFNSWVSPWGISSKESYIRDCQKKELAESKGYSVFYIWDTSAIDDVISIIEKLRVKIENYKHS